MTAKKRKILIIDDDDLVRETVKLAFNQADYEVATLEAPSLALTVVKRSKPDLILMDIYMPELNGIELCRKLKSDPQTKAIPVVLFTGSGETMDVISGIDAGAFEYITKPVDGEILLNKIRSILKLRPEAGDAR